MTLLAIVAYPSLGAEDRAWIESLRSRHDPQASRIKGHFTLVFPFELDEPSAATHARRILERFEPIPFAIRTALAVPDLVGGGSHVFLVPDEGKSHLEMWHTRLYSGVLAPFLRREIPFVPHLTVGAFEGREAGEQLAASLNRERPCIRGTVSNTQLVEVGEDKVRTVAEFPA